MEGSNNMDIYDEDFWATAVGGGQVNNDHILEDPFFFLLRFD